MTNLTTTSPIALVPSLEAAWRDVDSSFERFCLDGRHRGDGADAARGCATACRSAP